MFTTLTCWTAQIAAWPKRNDKPNIMPRCACLHRVVAPHVQRIAARTLVSSWSRRESHLLYTVQMGRCFLGRISSAGVHS